MWAGDNFLGSKITRGGKLKSNLYYPDKQTHNIYKFLCILTIFYTTQNLLHVGARGGAVG
jgi:hypothetical protein